MNPPITGEGPKSVLYTLYFLCFRDQQLLDDWRAETKDLQRKHYIRAVRNAQVQGKNIHPFTKGLSLNFQMEIWKKCTLSPRY